MACHVHTGTPDPNCPDCNATTAGGGGSRPTPPRAAPPAPSGAGKKALKAFLVLLGIAGLFALAFWLGGRNKSDATADSKSAPAASAAPAASNSAAAKADPTKAPTDPTPESCGEGTNWDPRAKRCVPAVAPMPSAFVLNGEIKMPCPKDCGAAPDGSAKSAKTDPSAKPAPTAPPPTPTVVPVTVKLDLTRYGDKTAFPGN